MGSRVESTKQGRAYVFPRHRFHAEEESRCEDVVQQHQRIPHTLQVAAFRGGNDATQCHQQDPAPTTAISEGAVQCQGQSSLPYHWAVGSQRRWNSKPWTKYTRPVRRRKAMNMGILDSDSPQRPTPMFPIFKSPATKELQNNALRHHDNTHAEPRAQQAVTHSFHTSSLKSGKLTLRWQDGMFCQRRAPW